MLRVIGVLVFCVSVLGCASTGDDSSSIVRPGNGKADFNSDAVQIITDLQPGDFSTGKFREDFQFFGYRIEAKAGAVISAEVMRKGSDKNLDSTLILYRSQSGSTDGFAYEVASDNDGGYGKLSRIDAYEVPATDLYILVVGTADARGRGDYRVELRCDSGEGTCLAESGEDDCEAVVGLAVSCTQESFQESECDPQDESAAECFYDGWVECINSDSNHPEHTFEVLCGGGAKPAYCAAGSESFRQNIWEPCVLNAEMPEYEEFNND